LLFLSFNKKGIFNFHFLLSRTFLDIYKYNIYDISFCNIYASVFG
jgi:hypothetical protein